MAPLLWVLEEIECASREELHAYIAGASRDGYLHPRHRTLRIAQSSPSWARALRAVLSRLDVSNWEYREGRRLMWVVESKVTVIRPTDEWEPLVKTAFVRGYFDAEGGVPRSSSARFYIQLCQKDREDLEVVRRFIDEAGIRCGRLHVPSRRIDPDYWRFYVSASGHQDFIRRIGSWHPRKWALLLSRCTPASATVDVRG